MLTIVAGSLGKIPSANLSWKYGRPSWGKAQFQESVSVRILNYIPETGSRGLTQNSLSAELVYFIE